ncbi:DNA polymerase III subunit gamma/tau [Aliidongia dinghuensis]|uniref:DNA polymerase III subunit gamma/tau n=1 Tax=Aliidongia dinghuensis TaxID=1867774 RepID=A0A8J2YS38_9PROT|nr:DNA polymerase III subunit gamma/tau [Aliidongia dinghuensis]
MRTLTNALDSGRIAHAFMLTGVRGVGKTTTARIIARALNCVGPDGTGGPTMQPCGQCDACRAIAEDRHPDVIEMDAASRTGVDDIRELIEGVRYRPVSARYKIYIIDEVHMLSKAAFNALLKTLEEPPPDIKFVFATTEINKVPVTVLSRCQRYTLPRIPLETLAAYYGEIAVKEKVEIEPGALTLVARAADGSVRDGLSILDQAIALGFGGLITEAAVRDMLGVADRGLTFDLFENVMAGDAPAALAGLETLYNGGTDPAMVLQDLLDVTHFVTRLKLERPEAGGSNRPLADGQDLERGRALAGRLGLAALARTWQMLLKGLPEVQTAPAPLKAAEMVLIRLVYVTDLPPPAELIKALQNAGGPGMNNGSAPNGERNGPRAEAPPRPVAIMGGAIMGGAGQGGQAMAVRQAEPAAAAHAETAAAEVMPQPASFQEVMELIAVRREAILYNQIAAMVHLVRFQVGHIELRPAPEAPRDLVTRMGQFLNEVTGQRWMIMVSREPGQPTLKEQIQAREAKRRAEVSTTPVMKALLLAFPGLTIDKIIDLVPEPEPEPASALPAELPLAPEPDAIAPFDEAAIGDPALGDVPAAGLYEEDDPGPFMAPILDPDDEDGDA